MTVYLDHNATSPLQPLVWQAMYEVGGNPSSAHALGRKAKAVVENAREFLSESLNCQGVVIFTSGGTEANALALNQRKSLVSEIAHDSAYKNAQAVMPLGGLEKSLAENPDVEVVSLILGHNETGIIEDIHHAARLIHAKGKLLHVDAVQALGKIPLDMAKLGADLLSISAHKIGGPVGVGALLLAPGLEVNPLWQGGGQEKGRRSGTLNLPGIVGLAKALELANQFPWAEIAALKNAWEKDLGLEVIGKNLPRLPNTTAFVLRGQRPEYWVMAFDLAGICLSAGAACSSGKLARPRVLKAMGYGEDYTLLRVSLGWNSQKEDLDQFKRVWDSLNQTSKAA